MTTIYTRKLFLTAHITSSVAWFGAVAGWLALAITALNNHNVEIVPGVDLSMALTGWFVIVPLAFAALLTGIVQSLGTAWGLFRHYWVLTKLLLTCFATIVLLTKMGAISHIAAGTLTGSDLRHTRLALVVHAGGGLLVLFAMIAISVFKPWGRTEYGKRIQEEERFALARTIRKPVLLTATQAPEPSFDTKLSSRVKVATAGIVLLLFILAHLLAGKYLFHSM